MSTPYEMAEQAIAEFIETDHNDHTGILMLSSLNLTRIPPLPAGITTLCLRYNPGLIIESLPEGLLHLSVSNCMLETLPPLPSTLELLYCSHNKLQSLPSLPRGLRSLDADNNRIRYVDDLPEGMNYLNLSSNPLREPLLASSIPSTLRTLMLNSCGLRWLPDSLEHCRDMESFQCANNKLQTLPLLPRIVYNFKWTDNLEHELYYVGISETVKRVRASYEAKEAVEEEKRRRAAAAASWAILEELLSPERIMGALRLGSDAAAGPMTLFEEGIHERWGLSV